jgi:hypothetical protein
VPSVRSVRYASMHQTRGNVSRMAFRKRRAFLSSLAHHRLSTLVIIVVPQQTHHTPLQIHHKPHHHHLAPTSLVSRVCLECEIRMRVDNTRMPRQQYVVSNEVSYAYDKCLKWPTLPSFEFTKHLHGLFLHTSSLTQTKHAARSRRKSGTCSCTSGI